MRIQNLEPRIKKEEFRKMKREGYFSILNSQFLILVCINTVLWFAGGMARAGEEDVRKVMKDSLVFLEVSSYGYDQFRPWRNTDVVTKGGVGCAVRANEVITPAWNLTDASLIQARIFGKNAYIPAKIKIIDYELDLALVELDANALDKPLKPVKFVDKFKRGAKLNYYWLNSSSSLISGQGYLDRAEVRGSTVSYAKFLNFVVTNTSQETGIGQLYFDGSSPVGISCWAEGTTESGIIPAVIINSFLSRIKEPNYRGIPTVGFITDELLDPARREYLKMPKSIQNGVEVVSINKLGTGQDVLKSGDVILAIDGKDLDAYGKFVHPVYDRVSFHHLITSHKVGDEIGFDIWREGSRQKIKVIAKNFGIEQMLVPFYEYARQPEYIVTGGYVFQKLTRPYLVNFGKDWDGKATPHLLHYLRDMAFKPSDQRRDIVILSYVLPAQINLGYTDLGQLVVSKYNGMTISSIGDIIQAQKLNPESKFDVVEFELDNPTVVIPRGQLKQADALVSTNYMIRKLVNIE